MNMEIAASFSVISLIPIQREEKEKKIFILNLTNEYIKRLKI